MLKTNNDEYYCYFQSTFGLKIVLTIKCIAVKSDFSLKIRGKEEEPER